MDDEICDLVLELSNEMIQFLDRNGLRKQFLEQQKERGFDVEKTESLMYEIENGDL